MIRLRLAGQLLLVGLLSYLSGYRWPPLADVNFDIVNMLTPLGLIQNLSNPNALLYPYYFAVDESTWHGWFVLPLIAFLGVNGRTLLARLGNLK